MSQILAKINQHLNEALKKKQAEEVLVLRQLLAAIHNYHIKLGKEKELEDEDILTVLQQEAKKRKDAILAYQKAQRKDLLTKEEKELKIIEKYLPQALSEKELQEIIKEAVKKTGAKGSQDFGKVMGSVMSQVRGRADGRKVKELVEKELKQEQ